MGMKWRKLGFSLGFLGGIVCQSGLVFATGYESSALNCLKNKSLLHKDQRDDLFQTEEGQLKEVMQQEVNPHQVEKSFEFNLWSRKFKIELRKVFYRELLAKNPDLIRELKQILHSSPILGWQIKSSGEEDHEANWEQLVSLKKLDFLFANDKEFIKLLRPSILNLYLSVENLQTAGTDREVEEANICLYLKNQWGWREFFGNLASRFTGPRTVASPTVNTDHPVVP